MKLNDPFGRVARRDRDQYAALRQRLRQAGVRDQDAVRNFARRTRSTLMRVVLLVLAGAAGMMLLFPDMRGPIVALAVLILAWIGVGYFRTQVYLSRYRREECDGA